MYEEPFWFCRVKVADKTPKCYIGQRVGEKLTTIKATNVRINIKKKKI
jgi:hypothetical protein